MPDIESNTRFDSLDRREETVNNDLAGANDYLMEEILENLNSTPIGQVLKQIASLPEVRMDKVLDVRHRLSEGQYDVNERLDFALDKVLEDLTA